MDTFLLITFSVTLGVGVAVGVLALGRKILFSSTLLHGPVYVPSKDAALESMLRLGKPTKKDLIIDLGSGDGKVVLACAKKGFSAVGVEINPWLVWSAKRQAKNLRLEHKAQFICSNFWSIDYSQYDLLFLYGTAPIMGKLEKKLQSELKPGTRVVSNHFQFLTWKPVLEENDVRVYTTLSKPNPSFT